MVSLKVSYKTQEINSVAGVAHGLTQGLLQTQEINSVAGVAHCLTQGLLQNTGNQQCSKLSHSGSPTKHRKSTV